MWSELRAARRAAQAAKLRMESVSGKAQTTEVRLNRPSGSPWTYTRQHSDVAEFPPAIDGNQVLFLTHRHSRWELGGEHLDPTDLERKDLLCLDQGSGKVLWQVIVEDPVVTWPSFFGDVVVYGTKDFKIVGKDRKDGTERFRIQLDALKAFSFGPEMPPMQDPVMTGGKLYVVTYGKGTDGKSSGKLYAVDLASGKLTWSQPLESGASGPPICLEELIIVGGGPWVQAIRAVDGASVWKVQTGNRDINQPIFELNGKVFAHAGGKLHDLVGRSGKEEWLADVPYESFVQGVGSRLFYVAPHWPGLNEWAVALDALNGKQVWETKLGFKKASFWMGWWAQDGNAFFGLQDEFLALRLSDGKEIWRVNVPGAIDGAPFPIGAQLLVAATKGGKAHLHALQQTDGKEAWVFDFEGSAGEGLLTGDQDGILFPGKGGKVICLH